jgi:hypothetical protein
MGRTEGKLSIRKKKNSAVCRLVFLKGVWPAEKLYPSTSRFLHEIR